MTIGILYICQMTLRQMMKLVTTRSLQEKEKIYHSL
jgi:hypothetical protein